MDPIPVFTVWLWWSSVEFLHDAALNQPPIFEGLRKTSHTKREGRFQRKKMMGFPISSSCSMISIFWSWIDDLSPGKQQKAVLVLGAIGCRKTVAIGKSRGKFSHLPHQTVPPNPITLCISSNSMAGVPTCKTKMWGGKIQDVRVEKIGGKKSSSHFLLWFGHLSVISQKYNYRKFPCVWCVSEKQMRFMLHLWRVTAGTCPHGGSVQIILPFFSCMMAVGSSRESSRAYMSYTKYQLIWV